MVFCAGKDLSSVTALLKRHARLAQAVAARADAAAQLADNARQLAADQHFMADDLLQQATSANDRYIIHLNHRRGSP